MTQEEVREENIKKVQEAAFCCMLEKGVNSITYELVAKRCALTTRSLRRYYGTLVDLVCDSIETAGWEFYQHACKRISHDVPQDMPGIQQVETLCRKTYEFAIRNENCVLLLAELDFYLYDHKVSEKVLNQYLERVHSGRNYLKQYLEHGVTDGTIRNDLNIQDTVTQLVNTFVGLVQRMQAVRYAHVEYNQASVQRQVEIYIKNLVFLLSPYGQKCSDHYFNKT